MHALGSSPLNIYGVPLKSLGALCAVFSFLVPLSCELELPCPLQPVSSISTQGVERALLTSPLRAWGLEKPLQAVSWGQIIKLISLVSRPCPSLSDVQCPENCGFIYFVHFCCSFRQESKSGLLLYLGWKWKSWSSKD